jgi:hypothetical protein
MPSVPLVTGCLVALGVKGSQVQILSSRPTPSPLTLDKNHVGGLAAGWSRSFRIRSLAVVD